MKRKVVIGIVAGVVVAAGAGIIYSVLNSGTTVSVAAVEKATLDVTVSATGTLTAKTSVGVFPPTAGTIGSLKVSDGDKVAKGDVLAVMAKGPLREAQTQAQAALSAAYAQADAAKSSTDAQKSAAADAVTAAKAALATAKDNLAKAELKAPAAGVVSFAAGIEKGAGLTPGVAAFTIVDQDSLLLEAAVDETDIAKVEKGQAAAVTLDAYPDSPMSGKVESVGQSATTTATGSVAFLVKITFETGSNKVLDGMSGSAEITVEQAKDALAVPVEAVLSDGGTNSVFTVASDGTVKKVAVKIGAETDTQVQITDGVQAGDRVVTVGAASLSDGQKVRIS
ncbi:MAG: efflux RND transporter periplasmic adaptor subunit [Propionibacteriaceae bacterium]|jgi:HlyD family secretion protein|nr:efflux RND transporter periplasmic adaptor subunit [Propionibacteriaceae bacterium]